MQPMKIIIDRRFTGQRKSIAVSKNKCDQYFVSVLVEEELELKQNTDRFISIDLGIKILNEGLSDLYNLTSAELVNYRHREAVRSDAVSLPKASLSKCLMNL
jgi:transposase